MRRPQLVHDRVHPGICWKLQQDLGEELKGQPAKQKEAVEHIQIHHKSLDIMHNTTAVTAYAGLIIQSPNTGQ